MNSFPLFRSTFILLSCLEYDLFRLFTHTHTHKGHEDDVRKADRMGLDLGGVGGRYEYQNTLNADRKFSKN